MLGKYFKCLDFGFVALLDKMGNDDCICDAARVSYSANKLKRVSDNRSLIRYLMRMGHLTPFEMCEMKFHVKINLVADRQFVRHRTQSRCELSGRYSKLNVECYTPSYERCLKQSETNKQGSSTQLAFTKEEYDKWVKDRSIDRDLLRQQYELDLQKGLTKELARIDLPLSIYTEYYVKFDLRNLFHFLSLRLDSHAQWEIQQYAKLIAGLVKYYFPFSWQAFVDYRLKNVNFSRQEMVLLSKILGSELCIDSPLLIKIAKQLEMSDREVDEFLVKLHNNYNESELDSISLNLVNAEVLTMGEPDL